MRINVQGQEIFCERCGQKLPEHKARRMGSKFVCFACIQDLSRKRLELRLQPLTTTTIEEERLRIAGRFQ